MADRDFKGVWIPRELWLNNSLNWSEKLLLTEIDSLEKLGECYATNEYFAGFLGLSKDRVSKIISSLSKKGLIVVKMYYKDNKEVEKRVLSTTIGYRCEQLGGIGANNYRGIGVNDEDNNTYTNNTFNKKEIYKEKRHKYGQYDNVLLTDKELETLKSEYNDWEDRIERVSSYCASTGKSYKNYLATIRNWARKEQKPKTIDSMYEEELPY